MHRSSLLEALTTEPRVSLPSESVARVFDFWKHGISWVWHEQGSQSTFAPWVSMKWACDKTCDPNPQPYTQDVDRDDAREHAAGTSMPP